MLNPTTSRRLPPAPIEQLTQQTPADLRAAYLARRAARDVDLSRDKQRDLHCSDRDDERSAPGREVAETSGGHTAIMPGRTLRNARI
jgi:hypothetical protein